MRELKQIVTAQIDYKWGGPYWHASLLDVDGEYQYGITSEGWEKIHDAVKAAHPDVKITYTPAGWQQNVTEFNRSLRRSR